VIPERAKEPRLRELVSAAAVQSRLDEMAEAIARDFAGRRPLFVVIAEGARRFTDALARRCVALGLAHEPARDQLVVRVRRTEGTELHEVVLDAFDAGCCAGRDVLVLDDIADEGRTLAAVLAQVRATRPRFLRTAVLVSKRARRRVDLELDHVGFELEDGWIVGFGMDLDGHFRDLDHLAVLA
jgi:hypoxanthine phosphoribosyltransferase